MPSLNALQRAALTRLQHKFKAGANTLGPLRCVLIHSEGTDFHLKLSPPQWENMPRLAARMSVVYSFSLYRPGPNGQEVPCKRATIGTGPNPFLTLDEKVSRYEPFAERDIYLLRNHKKDSDSWPIDPQVLGADPDWRKLLRRTSESDEEFQRLAGEAGRCFGAADSGVLSGVARESLEAMDGSSRWLWIVFDLAWQKVRGSPLQAARSVWHEAEGEGGHFYAWEMDFARIWERESKPRPGRDEAKRIEKIGYLKAWAERRPGFYYSSLDDLFSASVWAIDLLILVNAVLIVREFGRFESASFFRWVFFPRRRENGLLRLFLGLLPSVMHFRTG